MKFLTPTGIGDATWALAKAQSISRRLGDGTVEIALSCHDPDSPVETRSLEFVGRFPFVQSARMLRTGAVLKPGPPTDAKGRYRYIEDGDAGFAPGWYPLIPNAPLERGERLETWFPDDAIDWGITRSWANTPAETTLAANLANHVGPYAILYPGPLAGNVAGGEGHNRQAIWTPQQWAGFALRVREMGLTPVVIGASYDLSFWRQHVVPAVKAIDPSMKLAVNLIGQTRIGETIAVIRGSRLGVYYQSGLGVVSSYEGIPTAMFWRPDGNSIHPKHFLCFDERMASAWVPPSELESGRYLPCIYGVASVDSIAGWAATHA